MDKKIKIGTRITKEEYRKNGVEFYAKCIMWNNTHNAHMEDKGAYFEIVENKPYVPTIEEQVQALENKIEQINSTAIRDLIILADESKSANEKEEVKQYLAKKLATKKELVQKINELKNKNKNKEE